MKKYIFAAVFSLALLASPAFTQAAALTQAQINAIVSLLQSFGADQTTINNVQASLGGGTTTGGGTQPWCHTFNTDLTIGSSGDDVSALYTALERSRVYTPVPTTTPHVVFDEDTAGYVVRFQAKYGIRQTGHVGPITRAKLNALYGCPPNFPPPQPSITVLSPNGGETLVAGQTYTGSFGWNGFVPKNIKATLINSVIGSSDLTDLGAISVAMAGDKSFSFTIPSFKQPSSDYKINICEIDQNASVSSNKSICDASNAPFNIVAPNNTAEPYITSAWSDLAGNATMKGTRFGNAGSNVATMIRLNGQAINSGANTNNGYYIVNYVDGVGYINFRPADFGITTSGSYPVQIINPSTGNSNSVTLNYTAPTITTPSITVLSPNGGETWRVGDVAVISWKVNGTPPSGWSQTIDTFPDVLIQLYKRDTFVDWISVKHTGKSTLGWQIPSFLTTGSDYKIRVAASGVSDIGLKVFDDSDAPFSIIVTPPPIQVSTGGLISQKLHYVPSSNSFYGIGSDNAVWKWDNAAKQWSRITDGSIKDDFHFISESDIYAIGMDNQIWHWNGIRWSQESQGGKIQQKIWYVDGNHIYGIGMDNQVWRYGSAGGWTKITSNGQIKDDFHFISESEIYGIGLDGQIWKWNGTSWNQHSSGGAIKQKLQFVSSSNIWGIGADNRIWGWSNGIWSVLHDSGQAKDDFVIVGGNVAVYAIGLDNQIWKLPPRALGQIPSGKTFATLPPESFTVGGAYSNPGLAGALGAFSGTGTTGATTNQSVQSTSSFSYAWNRDLQIGSPHQGDIVALQQALAREGVYGGEITGGFYNQTYAAVKAFQEKYGINVTGYVGLITRSKLNALY